MQVKQAVVEGDEQVRQLGGQHILGADEDKWYYVFESLSNIYC